VGHDFEQVTIAGGKRVGETRLTRAGVLEHLADVGDDVGGGFAFDLSIEGSQLQVAVFGENGDRSFRFRSRLGNRFLGCSGRGLDLSIAFQAVV
jgi:hypothetical protein